MTYYAILDTNVLVSALLKTGSAPAQVTAESLTGVIIPVLNNEILIEYEDVLSRTKFNFDKNAVKILLDELKKRAVYLGCDVTDDEFPDADDAVFYAVLMEKRKDGDAYLITGNLKHFPLRTYIVTPREMLEIIGSGTP